MSQQQFQDPEASSFISGTRGNYRPRVLWFWLWAAEPPWSTRYALGTANIQDNNIARVGGIRESNGGVSRIKTHYIHRWNCQKQVNTVLKAIKGQECSSVTQLLPGVCEALGSISNTRGMGEGGRRTTKPLLLKPWILHKCGSLVWVSS